MRALDILNSELHNEFHYIAINSIQDTTRALYLQEAIKELEELNNRSCESCRTVHCPVRKVLVENDYINSNYFYCNDWEMKENK